MVFALQSPNLVQWEQNTQNAGEIWVGSLFSAESQ